MSKYSLVTIQRWEGNTISGRWLENCTGSKQDALKKALATEKANGNRITVAIVDQISSSTPDYSLKTGLIPIEDGRRLI